MRVNAASTPFRRSRLGHEREGAAREAVLTVLVERNDLHRNVTGQCVLLELAQHRPAEHVGQENVQRYRGRLILLGEFERIDAAHGDQHLEPLVAGEIDQDPGIMGVVLDDQQDRIPRLDDGAVVGDSLGHPFGGDRCWAGSDGRRVHQAAHRTGRASKAHGQEEREGRPHSGRTAQLDFAAEQARQLSADGEPETGAAVFSARRRIGLLESLEDDLLLLGRNADAGVCDFEGNDASRRAEHGVPGRPAFAGRKDLEVHPAALGELEGVRQQVLEHLLQPLGVGEDAAAETGINLQVESEPAIVRFVTEWPRHRFQDAGEQDFLGLHRDGPGLDLGQIENVADQVEEVGAGAVNGTRELDLLAGEIALRILGELLAEDEDRIERCSQLVRHVGEELGLVLGGEGELGRLLLQRAAGLLDLLVLAFHFHIALGELLRFPARAVRWSAAIRAAAPAVRRRAAAIASTDPRSAWWPRWS